MKAYPTTSAARALPIVVAAIVAAGCETVDLGDLGAPVRKDVPPTCAVSPADYKTLAYLRDDRDATKSARTLDLLKSKYANAAPVSGANPVLAAQSYVVAKPDVSPVAMELLVTQGCAAK